MCIPINTNTNFSYTYFLAPVPTFLTEQALYDIIDECESNDSYSPLIRTLGEIFSSIENLSKSFLQEASTPTDSATNLEGSGKLKMFVDILYISQYNLLIIFSHHQLLT